MSVQVDRAELEGKVKAMYRDVAEYPHGEFHFEMGLAMAMTLYEPAFAKVQLPDAAGWITSGLAVQVTPVVALKTIWWAVVSPFVNCTVSPWAIVIDFGT